MARKQPRTTSRRPAPTPWWRTWWAAAVGIVVLGAGAMAGFAILTGNSGSTSNGGTAWASLGTRDVHSLVFDPADAEHLYFGHHAGLLESLDGGRTWHATSLKGTDAMNVTPGAGAALQIAGHDVLLETTNRGRTWSPVPNDLPGLDLHAFVTDPADSTHAWAYAVGYGLFESTDRGRHWLQRQTGDWPVLAVTRLSGKTTLLSVSSSAFASSIDGGATWQTVVAPRSQAASLAAAPDGSILLAGTTSGVQRSVDRGKTWQPSGFGGTALTVAVSPSNAQIVGLVDEAARFFRSGDGGLTWPGPR